jgi:hypothetical protein
LRQQALNAVVQQVPLIGDQLAGSPSWHGAVHCMPAPNRRRSLRPWRLRSSRLTGEAAVPDDSLNHRRDRPAGHLAPPRS